MPLLLRKMLSFIGTVRSVALGFGFDLGQVVGRKGELFPQEHRSSSFILFALFTESPFRNYSPICSAQGASEEP